VATVLHLTGLHSWFEIFATVPEAIDAPVHPAPAMRACRSRVPAGQLSTRPASSTRPPRRAITPDDDDLRQAGVTAGSAASCAADLQVCAIAGRCWLLQSRPAPANSPQQRRPAPSRPGSATRQGPFAQVVPRVWSRNRCRSSWPAGETTVRSVKISISRTKSGVTVPAFLGAYDAAGAA
jgi:hypothetical protein